MSCLIAMMGDLMESVGLNAQLIFTEKTFGLILALPLHRSGRWLLVYWHCIGAGVLADILSLSLS